jgi:hypothetical protein
MFCPLSGGGDIISDAAGDTPDPADAHHLTEHTAAEKKVANFRIV